MIHPKHIFQQIRYGQHLVTDRMFFLQTGLCFFQYEFIKNKPLDFLPRVIQGKQGVTGGRNRVTIFRDIDKTYILFLKHAYADLRAGEIIQSDKMERIREWLPGFTGSGWMNVRSQDENLNTYLQKL